MNGKVVIVTGGSSGLGEAAAVRMARDGAKVVIAARRRDKGEAVARRVDGLFVEADVTRREDVERVVAETVAKYGRLDAAVNNAGIGGPVFTPVAEIEEEGWDRVLTLNLKAVWMCMKYEIPAMLRTGGGAIVNVSSIYGLKPSDVGHAPYCASKFGVIGLTKSAAVDYARQGIRVNAVCPGFTRSEMVDPDREGMGDIFRMLIERHSSENRLGEAEETAEAIRWLCSDESKFVNGAALTVDGGPAPRLY